ncbi:MAG: UDP-N-acetylglucosamine 2-epimerase (non-hydrolyzing) [Atopostipes suicloacalis]|nr:UDP-N-acetylglucosamine 2-epimerase (non-hydrolyzing) [Atopostipes suicloacalis]MDN6730638.1 UDP-N-acetylglucosamine 2-epimerase (non-hydrolyzing) [Atopostipes suicloacalis]
MMKIMTIFGTRPEGIKMVPVVQALNEHSDLTNIVVNTAQHREMLDQVLDLFEIVPDYDLDIMQTNQTLEELTGRLINKISSIIKQEQPDLVLVHGDTSTTFAGAYSAYLNQIPVGHVEAGLRTHNILSPFPEEMNRQMVGRIATYHFAPTETNRENLLKENIEKELIKVVGNTVIDVLLQISRRESFLPKELERLFNNGKKTILLTSHRRENLGTMKSVFRAIHRLTTENDDVQIIFPIHKNPKVRNIARNEIGDSMDIHLIEPLEYAQFIQAMDRSYLVITDSGGIQEEAPGLGKPVLVTRDTTERPEGITAGTLRLVGNSEDLIFNEAQRLLTNKIAYDEMAAIKNPFGQGDTAEQIIHHIEKLFSEKKDLSS